MMTSQDMVNVTLTTEQLEIVLRGLAKISTNKPDVWKVMDVFFKAKAARPLSRGVRTS